MKPALLIALPSGLTIGGVQVWAARTVNALAERGRAAGLILHHSTCAHLDMPLHPAVRVYRVPEAAPPLAACDGDLSAYVPTYQRAVDDLAAATGQPVVCVPCHVGDCAGVFAALTVRNAAALRLVGWRHASGPYDLRIIQFYQQVMGHAVGVSDALVHTMATALTATSSTTTPRIWNIPCGIPTFHDHRRARPRPPTTRPRLIYIGRLDNDLKRTLALPAMSDELTRLGVAHTLSIVGDGPAAADLARAVAGRDQITMHPAASPAAVNDLLDDHDVLVLPSRSEGLSLAMLEAAARGCVPVVTRCGPGCAQFINGENGLIVEAAPEADAATAGTALARGLAGILHRLPSMSAAAIESVSAHYALDHCIDQIEELVDAAAAGPPLAWPANRNPSFTHFDPVYGSGTVPPDGPARMRVVLGGCRGKKVIVHGAGRHSVELAQVLREFAGEIVAFSDDDPARWGGMFMGKPVVRPCESMGDVVVISSWLHEAEMSSRWAAHGVEVRRVYSDSASTLPHRLVKNAGGTVG